MELQTNGDDGGTTKLFFFFWGIQLLLNYFWAFFGKSICCLALLWLRWVLIWHFGNFLTVLTVERKASFCNGEFDWKLYC
jgi:hypothetical protein